MKKYGMIFVSVIFTLLITLIPNQKINAEELEAIYIDYSSWGEQHFGDITEELETLVNYLDSLGSDYYYYIYGSSSSVDLKLFKNKDNYNSLITPYVAFTLSDSSATLRMGTDKTYAYAIDVSFQKNGSDFLSKFESLVEKVNNDNFTRTKNYGISSSSIYEHYLNSSRYIVYATNIDNFYLNDTSIYALAINNIVYQPGSQLPTYSEFSIGSKIIVTSTLGCPIPNYDGDPMAELIKVDFSKIYNENYKYYYSYGRTLHELDVSPDGIAYITEYLYQFMYFYVYDENDNKIYSEHNGVLQRLGYLPDDYEEKTNIYFALRPGSDNENNNALYVKLDFLNITKYVNHYNFDVVINGEHLGSIQYYELYLNDKNYLDYLDINIKIYIDDDLYIDNTFTIGNDEQKFDDIYDDVFNDVAINDIDNNDSLFYLFTNSLNQFKGVIADIFNDCTYFFNNLDITLKYFYISVFILILFAFLIKFIL